MSREDLVFTIGVWSHVLKNHGHGRMLVEREDKTFFVAKIMFWLKTIK